MNGPTDEDLLQLGRDVHKALSSETTRWPITLRIFDHRRYVVGTDLAGNTLFSLKFKSGFFS